MKLVLFVPAWASAVEAMVGDGAAPLVQVVPSDVNTLPAVPAEVIPVPPRATAKVPDDMFAAFKLVTFEPVPLNAMIYLFKYVYI
jgi:hypothetical protein